MKPVNKGQLAILELVPCSPGTITNDEISRKTGKKVNDCASRMSELHRLGLVRRNELVIPWEYQLSEKGIRALSVQRGIEFPQKETQEKASWTIERTQLSKEMIDSLTPPPWKMGT